MISRRRALKKEVKMKFRLQLFRFALPVMALWCAAGCSVLPETAAEVRAVQAAVEPDYSKPESWAVPLPENPSSLPADVFYVYPTVFVDAAHPVMDIAVPELRRRGELIAGEHTMMFRGKFNIFAPHYRQAELNRALRGLSASPQDLSSMELGLEDIRRAFRHYLEHRNNGRPFLLMGHSQGAMAVLDLLKNELPPDSPALKRMVAAYVIGWPVTKEDLAEHPQLKMARGELDTGVVVSWNTEAPGAERSIFCGGVAINPLNWRTDDRPAPKEANLGAVFFRPDGEIALERPGFCGGALDLERGTLVVDLESPQKYEAEFFPRGVLHMGDILFFYRNIAENVEKRTEAFQKNRH